MRTIIETDRLPVCASSGALNPAGLMSSTKTISSHRSRSNSNSSEEEECLSNDYIFISSSPSSASFLFPSNTSSGEIFDETIFDDTDDYFSQFICPTDSDNDSPHGCNYDDDDNNDDVYLEKHLTKQQLDFVDCLEGKEYQRSKRSNKKLNAQRQIKTKHAKSIKTNSHNKHLYIHHRLAKKVALDEPSYHCIPSSEPVRLYSLEELRSIVYQHRHPYQSSYLDYSTSSRKARHSKLNQQTYIDESQINSTATAYQYREYTLHEYNIPDEPSYDDAMINFLFEMQNRDLSPEDYEMLLRLDERVQRKTINTNILDTLPTVEVNEIHLNDQCTICMEKYNLGQELKLLPCTHIFHSNCIETYLKEFSIQCPLDNLPLI